MSSSMNLPSMAELGARAKTASRAIALAGTDVKNAALRGAADLVLAQVDDILAANARDVNAAELAGATATQLDRLRLSPSKIEAMAEGLRQVASLPDPVGEITGGYTRPNGLQVSKIRVPLGVVAIIYENRPNVTSDAAALCIKAGNAAFLRGSGSAIESNKQITAALREAMADAGLPQDGVILVEDTRHEAAVEFMRQRDSIDCLIPRGGPSLIRSILDNATVPYVIDGDGNCHVFIDQAADLDMAVDIIVNAKTQRPSVCNAAESLLVHAAVADALLPRLDIALSAVELVGDGRVQALVPRAGAASDVDYATEFLDLKLAIRVVDSLDDAIAHIQRFGSGHSEAIVTNDVATAERFLAEVDAAAVLVNASTRFIDGSELGLGAEIGISTQKLHARGPMGLASLTTEKWLVRGAGQTRR